MAAFTAVKNFYPRPPRGGRRVRHARSVLAQNFYPRPPRGGRQSLSTSIPVISLFLSTPSARRATPGMGAPGRNQSYFYPRPPRGGRPLPRTKEPVHGNFYPRPPRGGRPEKQRHARQQQTISIHALREEGDWPHTLSPSPTENFYPRPPRGGRRGAIAHNVCYTVFLSTPSARRATAAIELPDGWEDISIHALREEGDFRAGRRRAPSGISIHALREEGDALRPTLAAAFINFYPRPPRGGRLQKRRKTSPLLFHYKTICTDLEELVQKHPKKQL